MDCEAAREGGCIFSVTCEMICEPCAARATGADPEPYEHVCCCPDPDPPVANERCRRCGRWVVGGYPHEPLPDLVGLVRARERRERGEG